MDRLIEKIRETLNKRSTVHREPVRHTEMKMRVVEQAISSGGR